MGAFIKKEVVGRKHLRLSVALGAKANKKIMDEKLKKCGQSQGVRCIAKKMEKRI